MPLHRVFHTAGTFTDDEKDQMAKVITKFYTDVGLPPFYVVVIFIEVKPKDFFFGGQKNTDHFVRISVEHLARTFASHERVKIFIDNYEKALEPFMKAKGYHWETQIVEADRNMWRMDGIIPPHGGTPAESEWKKHNRAAPYDPKDNLTLP